MAGRARVSNLARTIPLVPPPVLASSVRASTLAVGDRRLEAESYLTDGYILRQRIEKLGSTNLEILSGVWQPGRLKGIQVGREKGLPFLAATQVFDMRPTPRKWLSPSHTPDVDDRYVKNGWILVTCSGSVGDAIIAHEPHDKIVISHDLMRIVPKSAADRGYLYAYLRTHYARAMMRSTKYGNVIKHLAPEHLQVIPVVEAGESTKATLKSAIDRCFALRNESYALAVAAENEFAAAVGAVDVASAEIGFPVSARSLFHKARRLDAYSYNPAAAAALKALSKSGRTIDSLERISKRVFGVPRFKHVYTRAGIPYLDSEELFKINPELSKFIPAQAKADAEAYYVDSGWLLMACSGQIYGLNGSVALATAWHEKKIVSNHVLRIVPDEGVRAGYIQVALSHPSLGRPLVLREAFGTSIPEIDSAALKEMPIVRMGDLEDSIADKTERAAALRAISDGLENAATAFLETIIAKALGDASEDEVDAALANLRLVEIEAAPERLIQGKALRTRLARIAS